MFSSHILPIFRLVLDARSSSEPRFSTMWPSQQSQHDTTKSTQCCHPALSNRLKFVALVSTRSPITYTFQTSSRISRSSATREPHSPFARKDGDFLSHPANCELYLASTTVRRRSLGPAIPSPHGVGRGPSRLFGVVPELLIANVQIQRLSLAKWSSAQIHPSIVPRAQDSTQTKPCFGLSLTMKIWHVKKVWSLGMWVEHEVEPKGQSQGRGADSQSEKKTYYFGTREHQKVRHSILYSSPSHGPKSIPLSGRLLKKPLNLNIKEYCILCSLFVGDNQDLSHLRRCKNRPLFSPIERLNQRRASASLPRQKPRRSHQSNVRTAIEPIIRRFTNTAKYAETPFERLLGKLADWRAVGTFQRQGQDKKLQHTASSSSPRRAAHFLGCSCPYTGPAPASGRRAVGGPTQAFLQPVVVPLLAVFAQMS